MFKTEKNGKTMIEVGSLRRNRKQKKNSKKVIVIGILTMLVWIFIFYLYITYQNIEINPSNYEVTRTLSTPSTQTVEEAVEESQKVADVIENTTRKVVGISKLKNTGNSILSKSTESELGVGTGLIVTEDGYILSNEHVTGAKYSKCYITLENGNNYDGTVLWSDADLDLSITKINAKNFLSRPRILICCPSNITPVEKNAIKEAAERTGARKVYIEEEPKVAAIGAGMDISKPTANMVIDIGGGTTDIAILSLNGIVSSSSVKIAGNTLDQDIIKYIREKYKLLIGEKTAEDIKINFANVYKTNAKNKLEVRGRDLITGLPHTIEITQTETKEALSDSINRIIKAVKSVLEQTPPELSGDIVEKGLILTGGGALLEGLVELLEKELTIPVLIAETPLTCVVEGTGILLEDIKQLEEDQ